MKHQFLTLAIITVLMSFMGCRKDTEEFVIDDENIYTSTLAGLVSDQHNNPLQGVSINFKGNTTTTDQYGYYELTGVQVGDQHNFVSISKPGFFEGCRTFRTNEKSTITHKTQLIQTTYSNTFTSTSGGTVNQGDVELIFPTDAVVNDATGNAYNGDVQVAIHHIDPIDENSAMQMPGDLSASGPNNEIDLLRSYGMVYVELQSPSGEKLQIKEGKTVTMTATIPAELQAEAPSEIPMWHFNNNSGLWENEGVASKQGDKYVAEVPHFSCWNYDDREESIIVSGRVVDENGDPLSTAHILISAVDAQWGGHGNTNSDGTFSGRVTKGKVLDVSLLGFGTVCRNLRVHLTQIGPFSADATLGDIVVNTSALSLKSLLIKGSFVDCNNQTVTSGIVTINGVTHLLANGKLNVTLPYCNNRPSNLEILAIDRSALRDANSNITVTSDLVNLGTVTVCGDEADFVEVKCTNLNIDKLFLNEVFLEFLGSDSTFLIASDENRSYINLSIDANANSIGTLPVKYASIFINDNNGDPNYPKRYFELVSGSITITDNTAKSRREGSYTVTVKESQTTKTETFTGNFRIKY